MVASDVNCPKCKAKMEEGFNLEFGHTNRTSAESWVAGRPEGGWLGLKINGRQQFLVRTFRCTACRFLTEGREPLLPQWISLHAMHQHAYPPHSLGLLRTRRNRPRRRAAERRDERAPFHSITSSARASRDGGIVRPRPLAVARLIVRSNMLGAWTGRSDGLAPRKIRST